MCQPPRRRHCGLHWIVAPLAHNLRRCLLAIILRFIMKKASTPTGRDIINIVMAIWENLEIFQAFYD